MSKTERKTHTPAERATAALGVEQRRVDNIEKKLTKLRAEIDPLVAELEQAKARRDYLAKHPDLPANHTEPIPEVAAVVDKPKRGRAVTDSPQA
jgi:hypothetical protein